MPHSLTLLEKFNLLCIADRENMRVICVQAELARNTPYNIAAQGLNIQQPDLGRVFAIASYGMQIDNFFFF